MKTDFIILKWSISKARATGDAADLSKAENFYNSLGGGGYDQFSWDSKKTGVPLAQDSEIYKIKQLFLIWVIYFWARLQVMYQLTGTEKYKSDIESNTNQLIDQNQFTPGGMIFYQPWGPARHAANAAFLARQAVSSGIGRV